VPATVSGKVNSHRAGATAVAATLASQRMQQPHGKQQSTGGDDGCLQRWCWQWQPVGKRCQQS